MISGCVSVDHFARRPNLVDTTPPVWVRWLWICLCQLPVTMHSQVYKKGSDLQRFLVCIRKLNGQCLDVFHVLQSLPVIVHITEAKLSGVPSIYLFPLGLFSDKHSALRFAICYGTTCWFIFSEHINHHALSCNNGIFGNSPFLPIDTAVGFIPIEKSLLIAT
jgi:hypothetical protein